MGRDRVFSGYRTLIPLVLAVPVLIYTAFFSTAALPPYQYFLLFCLLAAAVLIYNFIEKDIFKGYGTTSVVAAIFYAVVALAVFHPTVDNVFRSDYWIIDFFFTSMQGAALENIKTISLFEFMGDIRFQPFAHILIYLRHLLFGQQVVLFHLANIALHVATGLLIFALLKKLTGEKGLAFFIGLIFLVLQSQFDTVVWTYHIYIIVATICFLAAFLLALRHLETRRTLDITLAYLLSLLSLFLYEPMIIAPFAITLFLIFRDASNDDLGSRGRFFLPIGMGVAAYFIYLAVTLYGVTLIEEGTRMSFAQMLTTQNLSLAIKGSFLNFWQSTFLKNIGITALINISDIVYIELPRSLYNNPVNILKLVFAFGIILLLRPPRSFKSLLLLLAAAALSHIFIISLGRVLSNNIAYVLSQPRYQYFVNAAMVVALGLLLLEKYQKKGFKPLILVLLSFFFFWNCQNALYANNAVDREMEFLNAPYYSIKAKVKDEPEARVFPAFAPFNNMRFFLGSDIALDLLLGESVTRFPHKARYIYDGKSFVENPNLQDEDAFPCLGDFSVSWGYMASSRTLDINVLGSDSSYPRISVRRDGFVEVAMKGVSGEESDIYRLAHPYFSTDAEPYAGWSSMEVRKQGETLSLYFNDSLADKVRLSSSYLQWSADGRALFGDYYLGKGGATYLTALIIDATPAVSCDPSR